MTPNTRPALAPVTFILIAAFSVQGGAAMAKGIFPSIGAAGTAAIRIGLSAFILLAMFHPPVRRFTAAQWRVVIPYGITIGIMNLLFYQAIAALCGCALLGEHLTRAQWAAVVLVVVASAGAASSVANRAECSADT